MTFIRRLIGAVNENDSEHIPLELSPSDFAIAPEPSMLEKNVEMTRNLVEIHRRRVETLTASIIKFNEDLRQASVSLSVFERAMEELTAQYNAGKIIPETRSDGGADIKTVHILNGDGAS